MFNDNFSYIHADVTMLAMIMLLVCGAPIIYATQYVITYGLK